MKWKKIEGFEYEVSTSGRVRSLDREVPYRIKTFKQKIKGVELKQKNDTNGYVSVCIFDPEGVRFYKRIHRLVAECYIPNPNNLPQVNHKDGNKKNNEVSNLEWVTQSQNMLAFAKENPEVFYKPHTKRITSNQVTEIRRLVGTISCTQIAKRFGIKRSSVYSIVNRITWKNV